MKYCILIFMAKNRMAAIDIDADHNVDMISIDGNNVMEYKSGTQIKEFCHYIKSYYNIDSFSDLEMEISILRFDAVMEDVLLLLDEIRGAREYNLIGVEKVLPWIAVKEGLLKVGTAVQMETFDLTYTVSLDNDMVLGCTAGGTDTKHSFILPKEKFSEYYHLNKKDLLGYEDEKNAISEKYEKKLRDKERRIKELEQQIVKAGEKTKEIEKRLEETVSKVQEKEKSINGHVCRLIGSDKKQVDYTRSSSLPWFGNTTYTYTLNFCCNNADIIRHGQKIVDVKVSLVGSRKPERDFAIKAKADGRIFWLYESGAECKYETDIAIIGDLSDTKEDVMKWYNKNW